MNQSAPSEEYAYLVKRAGQAAIIAASLLIIVKLIAWIMTGSSSILAALTDSLMDVTTSIINLFAIKIALQPADKEHRFGHGKAESLAGLAQAAFISGSSVFLMINGISAVVNNHQINASSLGVSVMLFSLVVTIALVLFQRYVVIKTNSMAIKADALHYRTDIILNGAVLLAIVLAGYGWDWADGVFAIAVSLYILQGAWEIGTQSIDALMDKQLPQEDQELILKLAYKVKGVRGVHDLRTRYSSYIKFIQLHLELDDEQSLFDAHEKADELELALETAFPGADILIHLDPISVVPNNKSTHEIEI
ncbi:cation diffusion facilitator family transporter [Psychromonas sp. SP041]|uniref:cation diffusion facilitator family transporter n=1 Tax=Psychromonas sp. SP041 TaxID=1365007 RepID=UPI000415AFC5|nr:cation diffusion facilitator family transporter [Psychromonas sp. SP041]